MVPAWGGGDRCGGGCGHSSVAWHLEIFEVTFHPRLNRAISTPTTMRAIASLGNTYPAFASRRLPAERLTLRDRHTAHRSAQSCGCRKLCHLMRPAHIRGSCRRAGRAAGRGDYHLILVDRLARRANAGSVSGVAGVCCCDRHTHSRRAADAVPRRSASGPGIRGERCRSGVRRSRARAAPAPES